jgi:hypothetical protein
MIVLKSDKHDCPLMPFSFKIIIGAAITILGVVGLFYMMPMVSNAAASKGPVFTEADVPKFPDNMKVYIPIEIGAAGAVIVGISFMAVGLGETLSPPSEESDHVEVKTKSTESHDEKSGAAESA